MDTKIHYKIIADCVATIHAAYNIYLLAGSIISIAIPGYAPFHIAVVFINVTINHFIGGCPLTQLERFYRFQHDENCLFGETFYGHYFFDKILGIEATKRQVTLFLFFTKVLPVVIPISVVIKTILK